MKFQIFLFIFDNHDDKLCWKEGKRRHNGIDIYVWISKNRFFVLHIHISNVLYIYFEIFYKNLKLNREIYICIDKRVSTASQQAKQGSTEAANWQKRRAPPAKYQWSRRKPLIRGKQCAHDYFFDKWNGQHEKLGKGWKANVKITVCTHTHIHTICISSVKRYK